MSLLLVAAGSFASRCLATTYYVSPSGNDSANGLSQSTPVKTFHNAFTSKMAAGDELILLDGTYSTSAGTGYINWADSSDDPACVNVCDQPPSGSSSSAMTYVHALNPGNVTVDGGSRQGLFLGRSFQKQSFIKIQGITFQGGGALYNTSNDIIKDCGFHSTTQTDTVFGIGTNDGNWGNSFNLIEDDWIWGQERIMASNYRAENNVWRRIIIRGDGCSSAACSGSGNPNVGFTVYNSSHTSIQNIIVVNRILGGGSPYADFATAQHNPGGSVDTGAAEYLSNNEWLGCMSLNSADAGFEFEADNAGSNEPTIRNTVAWDTVGGNFDIGTQANNVILENITAGPTTASGDGIRVAPGVPTSGALLANVIAYQSNRYGVNSIVTPSYSDVFGAASSAYNQTTCSVGCKTTNPTSDGTPASVKYVARIESGSALSGTGLGSADYGANIVKSYGVDGSFYGNAQFDTLSTNTLWPWPNEARIKSDMCSGTSRGFCGSSSLTEYIWTYLGNSNPYGGGGGTAPTITTQPSNQTVTAGQTATFVLVATGTPALSYQWYKNGASIGSATATSYTTPVTTSLDNGTSFYCQVTNTAGTVSSSTATLTVDFAPAITTQPSNQTVAVGQTATFSLVGTGNPAPSYQWYKNGGEHRFCDILELYNPHHDFSG